MKKIILSFIAVSLLSSFSISETLWTPDNMHSQLNFSATHFGISHVDGRFQSFSIQMKSEKPDFSDAQIDMTAKVNSINTEVAYRDEDLKGLNWFEAAKYPTLVFKSTSFKHLRGKMYLLRGDLTLHGVTQAVEFYATLNGWAVTMTKKNTAGFTVRGKLKRSDYGLGGTQLVTGVSDEIMVWTNVELGKN